MNMVGSPGLKSARRTRLSRDGRHADTGHRTLQLYLGEPEVSLGVERGVDGVDALRCVGDEIEHTDEHAVVHSELLFGGAFGERHERLTRVPRKIVRTPVRKPGRTHVRARVNGSFARLPRGTPNLDVEALRHGPGLDAVGRHRCARQIRKPLGQLHSLGVGAPETEHLDESLTLQRSGDLNSRQVSDGISV